MSIIRTKLQLKRPRSFVSDEAPKKKVQTSNLTKAEEAFKKHHEKIFDKNIDENVKKTHRAKVEKYNKLLTDLPEHNDIPRVGPG